MIYKRKRYGKIYKSDTSSVLKIINRTCYLLGAVFLMLAIFLQNGGYGIIFSEKPVYKNGSFSTQIVLDTYSLDEQGYMQSGMYYQHMRYASEIINYSTIGCKNISLSEIDSALSIIENKTIIKFNLQEESDSTEITINCDLSPPSIIGYYRTLGDSSPDSISIGKDQVTIKHTTINLYKIDKCPPHIVLHELMHGFGFKHSNNPESFMYPTIDCENQKVNEYFFTRLNELYGESSSGRTLPS